MDDREFDALVHRLTSGTSETSRRGAVRAVVGVALASASVAGLTHRARGKGKGKNGRQHVSAASNAVGNGKRILCFCPDEAPANCSTKRLKTKKAKKRLKSFPNSYRGRCDDGPTTSTTEAPTTTLSPTTTSTSTTTLIP